jgi:hypothetical protein
MAVFSTVFERVGEGFGEVEGLAHACSRPLVNNQGRVCAQRGVRLLTPTRETRRSKARQEQRHFGPKYSADQSMHPLELMEACTVRGSAP